MKSTLTIAFSFFTILVFAQTPGGMNYQAVARDGSGVLIKNKSISVKAVLLTGSSGSNVEYTETHAVNTNDYGLFTVIIGEGSSSDNFGALSWGTKKHHLKIEIDNGIGFVNMGTMTFQAVPYALIAKNVENIPTLTLTDLDDVSTSGAANGQVLGWDGSSWTPVNASVGGTTYSGGSGITITGNTIDANAGNAIWNADKLQNRSVANTSPSTGQVLTWSGVAWAPSTISVGNTYTAGTGLTLTGTAFSANTTTALWNSSQLQGRNISSTAPASSQVLKWNGSNWAPAADDNTAYTAGTGLTLTGTSFSANTTTALWNSSQLQGRNISSTAPASSQVLKWNGSNWAPATDDNTAYTSGTGLTLTGTVLSANTTSALWNASKLQGRNLSATAPALGQLLGWDGTNWSPETVKSSPWESIGTTSIHTNKSVGIGRDSALTKLDIIDTITGTGNSTFSSTLTEIRASKSNLSSSVGHWMRVVGSGGYENIGYRSAVLGTSTAAYNGSGAVAGLFIVDGSGGQNNFGVRISCAFSQTATVRNYGVYSHSRGNGTFNMGVFALSNRSTTGTGKTNYGIYAQADSGATNYAGYFVGNVTYTGTLASASDAKLKNNVVPFEGALDKLENLKVKTYEYKQVGVYGKMNLPEGKQFGFIAQELEQTFPELVENQVHAVNAENNKLDAEAMEYKAVNYIGMIPILTKAIQEQQDYIKKLEARIQALENTK